MAQACRCKPIDAELVLCETSAALRLCGKDNAASPYRRMAFPNDPPDDMEWLNMRDLDPAALSFWRKSLLGFVRTLTFDKQKPLILKSPPHTGRVTIQ